MNEKYNLYAHIHLLKGFKKPLIYKVPPHLALLLAQGNIVTVPFHKRYEYGIITQFPAPLPSLSSFTIKEIEKKEIFPDDFLYHSYIEKIAHHYFIEPHTLYERLYSVLYAHSKQKNNRSPMPKREKESACTLTSEQQHVVTFFEETLAKEHSIAALLHGVTGSGKSEVYASLINTTIHKSKSVLLLLPDVSLALQFQKFFLKKFGSTFPILGFHSASSEQEKQNVWNAMCAQTPSLIIGVHLPALLPCPNLGLIIVDEEHDRNFQEKKNPRLCSKHIALLRAQHYKIPILLGSATPSLASLYEVKQKRWKFFQLTKRFLGTFPSVTVVPLAKPTKKRSFWISKELETEIKLRLEKNEQVLIYINRRGYSFFILCKECGFVFTCSACSVSLTVHTAEQSAYLQCHYCSLIKPFPSCCESCKASENSLLKKGIGTQHVVSLLASLFPQARIARADLETTRKRKSWKETIDAFEQRKIDILVGTQTITKGYHFPHVTLVGIIWGDLHLHLPTYDATERTLQQLIQVAGRAGRATEKSSVIVQIIHNHPIFSYIEEQKYLSFYKDEIECRKQLSYPPCGYMLTIELSHGKGPIVHQEALDLHTLLNSLEPQNPHYKIMGPLKPPIYKIQKKEYRHIIIKSSNWEDLEHLVHKASSQHYKSSLSFIYAQ